MPLTEEQREKFDLICDRIAAGESVKDICQGDDAPCHENTFYRWLQKDDTGDLADAYRLAREIQADRMAEEMIEIADDASNDYMERDGKKSLDSEHVQRSRLRIDTRKFLASKLKPKVYGDKLEIDNGRSIGDMDIGEIRAELKQLADLFGFDLPPRLIGDEKDGD